MRIIEWSSDVFSSDLLCRLVKADIRPPLNMWRSEKSLVLKIQERNAKGKIRIDEKDKPLAIPEWHSFRGLVVPGGKRKTNADKSGLVALICASQRSEEHTSELQSLMRISYAVFCLKKNKNIHNISTNSNR